MLVVKSRIQEIVKANNKRMSKKAWEALDSRITALLMGAIRNCGHHSTITDTEIYMSGRPKC